MTAARLRHLDELCQNEALDLSYTAFGAEHLDHLGAMRHLQDLRLTGTPISDADLVRIAEREGLRKLDLDETAVGEPGLRHVARLARLECLSLNDTNVDDAGLEHVRALPHLEWLSLVGTAVSDRGLAHLASMASLRYLSSSTPGRPASASNNCSARCQVRIQFATERSRTVRCARTALAVGLLGIAGGSAACTGNMPPSRAAAVARVEDPGGFDLVRLPRVRDRRTRSGNRRRFRRLRITPCGDDDLAQMQLGAFGQVYGLSLLDTRVTDAALRLVALLPALQRLVLERTRITDAGLAELGALRELRRLTLSHTDDHGCRLEASAGHAEAEGALLGRHGSRGARS